MLTPNAIRLFLEFNTDTEEVEYLDIDYRTTMAGKDTSSLIVHGYSPSYWQPKDRLPTWRAVIPVESSLDEAREILTNKGFPLC